MITYDQIQSTAVTFAKAYRTTHTVPALPQADELLRFENLLYEKFPLLVEKVKQHLAQFELELDHGYDHLVWVAGMAGWMAQREVMEYSLSENEQREIVEQAVLAGFLHDIDRQLGFGDLHQIEGKKTAARFFMELGLDFPNVLEVIRHHDELDFVAKDNLTVTILYGCVFDADHFRYGLEREDTFWLGRQAKGVPAEEIIHQYDYLPKYMHAWKTTYGKQVGPVYLEFGLAIAHHVEESFSPLANQPV